MTTTHMRPNGAPHASLGWRWFQIRPEAPTGRRHASLGQRPRSRSAEDSPALKGRPNRGFAPPHPRTFVPPLQGLIHCRLFTQGVALGWHGITPLGLDLRAIARAGREIALMQEYRTRLTADVVTGTHRRHPPAGDDGRVRFRHGPAGRPRIREGRMSTRFVGWLRFKCVG